MVGRLILRAFVGATLASVAASVARAQEQAPEPPVATPDTTGATAERVERSTKAIQEKAGSAVVSVRVTAPTFRFPKIKLPGLVLSPLRETAPEHVEATAFFVTKDGHVVTTSDAVRGGGMIEVRFADGTLRDARLLGVDEPFRLAVLRTAALDTTRALEDSTELEPGRRALGWLLGAPESIGQAQVQIAAIRAATRSDGVYDRYLTSPLSLLPGAAGGPLLSERGELFGMAVGMTTTQTAPLPRDNATSDGAAPRPYVTRSSLFVRGEDILRAVEEITKVGRVKRARLGVMLEGDTTRVDQLLPGGPAEAAGVHEGDVVVLVGGVPVANAQEISRLLLRRKPGETVSVGVRRGAADVIQAIVLEDVGMPQFPATPPMDGAVLELGMSWQHDPTSPPLVTFLELEPAGAPARAGIQVGDRLKSVDGMDAARYLSRHRIRAATLPPSVLEIERNGESQTITLPR